MDWLFTKGRMISDNNRFTHELATRLVESGAPLDGLRIMVRTLNPQVLAYSDFWSSSDNATHTATALSSNGTHSQSNIHENGGVFI